MVGGRRRKKSHEGGATKISNRQAQLLILSVLMGTCAIFACAKSKLISGKHQILEPSIQEANRSIFIPFELYRDSNDVDRSNVSELPIKLSDQEEAYELSNEEDRDSAEDDDEEDEIEDDSGDLNNQNSIDETNSAERIENDLEKDYPKADIAEFKDFDDLKTENITYPPQPWRKIRDHHHAIETDKTRTRNIKSRSRSSDTRASSPTASIASSSNLQNSQVLQVNCALILSRGICITYSSVEWAIRRARNELNFDISGDDLRSTEPAEETINAVGELNELVTKHLAVRYQLSWWEIAFELENINMSRTSLWRVCPMIFRQIPLCPLFSRYRSHTGHCNNLIAPYFGSTNMPFVRMVPANYFDGIEEPRRASLTQTPLPPARLVALNLHPTLENPSNEHSSLFMAWGQLVNHDLAMASAARENTGHGDSCCPRLANRGLCMPIEIDPSDPFYSQFRVRCHEFKRSLAGVRPGCTLGPRTQINTITSFIDVSFVYGSSRTMMNSLRHTERGLLDMWDLFEEQGLKPMLPAQTTNPNDECVGRSGRNSRRFCFRSGDLRTNQHVQLVALHTIHARQHNRLALALGQLNPHWTNNRIYHEARHIHIAMVQHILLSEYLPALLGTKICKQYKLTESSLGSYWDHYDPSLNPGISQAFAAAAFRHGHSRVPSLVYRFNVFHQPVRAYALRDLYRQPWHLYEPGALDEFVLGMIDSPAESYDPFISLELSGFLLKMPNERFGLDLAAINIQRGRDQGVPSYNTFREWCGLKRLKSFEDLLSHMNSQSVAAMSLLYETVDDIDLYSGGLSEFPLAGSEVGPTFACIIARQFQTLRAADRFWFESSMGPHSFTLAQLDSIKQVSLAGMICANSDGIMTIQQMAMQQAHPVLNPISPCGSLPDLDISLWLEPVIVNMDAG